MFEDEEHLLFDCCSTSRLRLRMWSALTEEEAHLILHSPPGRRLEALLMSERKMIWDTLGEVFFEVWCRPQQAWRQFRAKRKWAHTDDTTAP